jgi:hypothetical protein
VEPTQLDLSSLKNSAAQNDGSSKSGRGADRRWMSDGSRELPLNFIIGYPEKPTTLNLQPPTSNHQKKKKKVGADRRWMSDGSRDLRLTCLNLILVVKLEVDG